MPPADVEVSADLVRRLLADQHPDLARLPVAFLANGWDNELYRVGAGLVARLPRRALGAQIIRNEQRWLPGLAARLPLPIPSPERTGVPACGYPYSWSVVPYLPGVPAAQASSFDPARQVVMKILPFTRIGVECPGSTSTRQRNTPGASKLSGNGPTPEPAIPSSERKYLRLPSAELAINAKVVAMPQRKRSFFQTRGVLFQR